jgi:YD repeat-containing protein
LNRQVAITDPNNIVIQRNVYDANGNVIKKIDAKGVQSGSTDQARYGWIHTYDLANRLVTTADPMLATNGQFTKQYRYNIAGETLTEIDALGNETVYAYDQAGRLVSVTDPLGIQTAYGYDKAGNKLFMVDGRGKVTRYRYGSFGVMREAINADSQAIRYQYDLVMNTVLQVDRNGNHIRYTYDARNLLTSNSEEANKRLHTIHL